MGRIYLGWFLFGVFGIIRAAIQECQPILGDPERFTGFENDLLDGLVVHENMIATAQVLKQPAALVGMLQLRMAAGNTKMGQMNIARGFSAYQQPGTVQRDLPSAALPINHFQDLHRSDLSEICPWRE